jgi:hypothetical protein
MDELGDELPVQGSVSLQTHPLPTTVRRSEESLTTKKQININRIEAKRN